jgi:hypothetical protein
MCAGGLTNGQASYALVSAAALTIQASLAGSVSTNQRVPSYGQPSGPYPPWTLEPKPG